MGLIGIHQLIRLDLFVSIQQYSHEGRGPGFGRGSGHVSPCGISSAPGRCLPFFMEHHCDIFAVVAFYTK